MKVPHIYPQTPPSPLQYEYLFNTQLESHIPIIPTTFPLVLSGYVTHPYHTTTSLPCVKWLLVLFALPLVLCAALWWSFCYRTNSNTPFFLNDRVRTCHISRPSTMTARTTTNSIFGKQPTCGQMHSWQRRGG